MNTYLAKARNQRFAQPRCAGEHAAITVPARQFVGIFYETQGAFTHQLLGYLIARVPLAMHGENRLFTAFGFDDEFAIKPTIVAFGFSRAFAWLFQ